MTTMTGAYGAVRARRRVGERVPAAAGRLAARVVPHWATVRRAVLVLGGFGAISAGLWMIAPAAGLIAAGVSALIVDALAGD
jgi:hypothetical protein